MKFAPLLALMTIFCTNTAHAQEKSMTRLFEMRTYTATEGKLDALNARFREHTNRLVRQARHDADRLLDAGRGSGSPEHAGLYPGVSEPRGAREVVGGASARIRSGHAARDASEKAGKIVEKVDSKFLTPTDYSPIK